VSFFADHETELLPLLQGLSAGDTAVAMRSWKARFDAVADDDTAPEEPQASVHLSAVMDGRWRLDGDLDPETGQLLDTALAVAQPADFEMSMPQRRADALGVIAKFFLDHQTDQHTPRNRPHLNVIVDIDALAEGNGGRFADGTPIDGPTMAALLCDSSLHRLVMAGRSTILDHGTATRVISPALWGALVARDQHCRFPGCDRPARWTDAHHVIHVGDRGATCPENLVVLCRRHHRRLHQTSWHAKLHKDATLEVTDPNNNTRTTRPPGTLWDP
jgi:hypothetical protein